MWKICLFNTYTPISSSVHITCRIVIYIYIYIYTYIYYLWNLYQFVLLQEGQSMFALKTLSHTLLLIYDYATSIFIDLHVDIMNVWLASGFCVDFWLAKLCNIIALVTGGNNYFHVATIKFLIVNMKSEWSESLFWTEKLIIYRVHLLSLRSSMNKQGSSKQEEIRQGQSKKMNHWQKEVKLPGVRKRKRTKRTRRTNHSNRRHPGSQSKHQISCSLYSVTAHIELW